MPTPMDVFTIPSQSKADALQSTSEAKAVLVSDISAQKRADMLQPVENAIQDVSSASMGEAINSLRSSLNSYYAAPSPIKAPIHEETLMEAASRGGYEALMGVPMTAVGLAAGGAAIGEKVFGKGGYATDLKESAVNSYRQFEEELGKNSRPEDSATYSYNQAKEGNLGALISWAAHGSGYVGAQLASMLVGVGMVEKGVELTGKKAVGQLMKTWVEKEAGLLAGEAAVTPEIIAQATSQVASKVGQHIGMAATGYGMEGGEILGDLASKTVGADGKSTGELSNEQILKGLVGTGVAGTIEYGETLLGWNALKGKLGKLPIKNIGDIDGLAGKAVRAGLGGAEVAVAEGAQEFAQTGVEQVAKGDPVNYTEMVDAGWLGALGAQHAILGGAVSNSSREELVKNVLKQADTLVKASSQPDHVEKIQGAVEVKDVSQYADPKNENYNPEVGVSALKVMSEQKDTPAIDKDSHYNQAVAIYNGLQEKAKSVLDSVGKGETLEKDAEAYVDKLTQIRVNIGPMIQAMGPKGTTSPALKQKLLEAQDSMGVKEAISNILGSDARGQDIESKDIPTEQILNNTNVDDSTKQLVKSYQELLDSQAEIVSQREKLKPSNEKTTLEVTDNIFNSSGEQKGVNMYISAIQNAVTEGKTEVAQKELDGLTAFAEQKQQRATDFRAAMNGTVLPAKYNQGRKTPYKITGAFKDTVKAMELEAATLGKAVVFGSNIVGLPSASNPPIVSSSPENVSSPRSVPPAVLTAQASTMSSTSSARPLAKVEVEGSSYKLSDSAQPGVVNIEKILTGLKPAAIQTMHSNAIEGTAKKVVITDFMQRNGIETNTNESIATEPAGNKVEPATPPVAEQAMEADKNTEQTTPPTPLNETKQVKASAPSGVTYTKSTESANAAQTNKSQQENQDGQGKGNQTKEVLKTEEGSANKETPPTVVSSESDTKSVVINETGKSDTQSNLSLTDKIQANVKDITIRQDRNDLRPNDATVVMGDTNSSRAGKTVESKEKVNTSALPETKNFIAKALDYGIHTASDFLGSIRDKYKNGNLNQNEKAVYAHIGKYISDTIDTIKGNKDKKITALFYDRDSARDIIANTTDDKQRVQYEGYLLEDPLNELATDGILPDKIAEAIGAVSYKWLATRGSETWFNEDKDIIQMFDLDEDAEIIGAAHQHIQRLGTSVSALSESIGRDIYKMLGYKAKDTTQTQHQERMEVALGLMALASMEKMGMLERKTVSRSAFTRLENAIKAEDSTFTMTAQEFAVPNIKKAMATWREAYKGKISDREAESKKYSAEIGANIKFFRISDKARGDGKTTGIKATYNKSDRTWDKLFSKEQDITQYGWEEFENQGMEKLHKSDQVATAKQTENKNRNENRPFFMAHNTVNVLDFLAQEYRDNILGKEPEEGLQEDQTRATISTNVGIDRLYDHMQAWKQSAMQQPAKLASLFYIPAWFGANDRMYQAGTINLQGNKIHRYTFSMSDWISKFNPSDTVMSELFHEAVGQSLGIEVSKRSTWGVTRKEIQDKLDNPIIQEALHAIDKILDIVNTDTALEEADLAILSKDLGSDKLNEYSASIAAGVAFGKEAVHSLKGLIEYQRFQRAKAAEATAIKEDKEVIPFTTDLTIEIDGKANGSAIGGLQMTAGTLTKEQLAIYESVGISFASERQESAHSSVPDPYQAIGGTANTLIKGQMSAALKLVQSATGSAKQKAVMALNTLKASESLLGRLNDPAGALTDAARKLAKNRSVEALYGAGILKVKHGLMNSVLIKGVIQKKLTQFANSDLTTVKVQTEYAEFLLQVNTMAGTTDTMEFGKDVPLTKKGILGIKLSSGVRKGLYANLSDNYGEAIWQGIATIYEDIRKTREPLNRAITIAVAYYNAAYSHLIEEHLDKHVEITVGDLARIREQIKGLFPRVKTPFYDAKTDTGYIEVAQFERSKDYAELEPEGYKETSKQRTDRKARNAKIEKLVVRQRYNEDTGIVVLTGRPHVIPMLENPGVKGVVTIIHMLDSMIANKLIGNKDIGILNVHDGFIVGLHRADRTNEIANQHFYEVMQGYNVSEAIEKSRTSVMNAMKALDIPQADKEKALTIAFDNFKLFKSYIEDGEWVDTKTVGSVYAKNDKDVARIKNATEANKTTILETATSVNQYHSRNGGYITGNEAVEKIGSIKTTDIIPLAIQSERDRAEANVRIDQELDSFTTSDGVDTLTNELGSSKKAMSTDPGEYQITEQVNECNVVDTYDFLKPLSDKQDSVEHDTHLKWILNRLVYRVMGPIDVYLKVNNTEETHGQIDLNNRRIFVSSQAAQVNPSSGALTTGIRMSTGEVYVHELVHAVIHTGLQVDRHLRKQVEILYNLTKKELDKNGEGFRAFLNNPLIDITDTANVYEVEAAKERFDYIFNGGSVKKTTRVDSATQIKYDSETDNKLEEFVVLGLTNENFLKAITQIDLVKQKATLFERSFWDNIRGQNLQQMLISVLNRIMEMLWDKFDKGVMQGNVGAELQRLAELLVKVDSNNKTKLYNATTVADIKYRKFMDLGNHYVKQFFKKTPIIRKVNDFKVGLAVLAKSHTPLGQFLRNVDYKYRKLDFGLMKSLATEMAGHTPRFARIHELLHRRNVFLDSSKNTLMAVTKKAANDIFTIHKLSAEDKVTLYKFMKTDLSGLVDHMSVEKIITLVKNKKSLQLEIDRIRQEIAASDLGQHTVYYDQNARALGHFLVHGRLREGEHTFPQTRVIASLENTEFQGTLTSAQIDQANDYVNQLTSLYALRNTSQRDLTNLASIADEDLEGFAQFLGLHNELKKTALNDAFNGSDMLMIKGYTKEILNPSIDYRLGTLADEKDMKAQGYDRSKQPIQRDDHDPVKQIAIYAYISRTNRINDFNSQILSMTNNLGKGADAKRLAQQMGDDTVEGIANNKAIIKAKEAAIKAMFTPFVEPTAAQSKGNYMVPQVNERGKITKYRYMMAESTKNDFLEKVNDFDTVMGAMAAQTLDKLRSPQINEELVDALKFVYDDEYSANPGSFIEIGPHSADPRLRERFYMMPPKTRAYVKQQWGNETMFVPKDMLTIAFGYRKYSIMEAFAKTPAERQLLEKLVVNTANFVFRAHGAKVVNNIELVMMALTKLAKNNIVVKALTVTLGNLGSNMMYLRSRGVSNMKILQHGMTAIRDGIKYQDDMQELGVAEIKRKVMTDPTKIKEADTQIRNLKDRIARNPVTRVMEAGMMPTFVDDVETDITQNNFPSKAEQLVDKATKYVPSPLVTLGKIAFLTQDTGAYKIMNNAVKMTDFVGRYILYQYYMSEIEAKPELKAAIIGKLETELGHVPNSAEIDDQAHKESVARVMEEFINFDLPTHKTIEYMNSIGLVWFSKYTIRVQKMIAYSIMDKPFDAAAAYLLSLTSGMDNILNSTIGVTKDMFSVFGNPISVFTGSIDEIFPISSFMAVFPK